VLSQHQSSVSVCVCLEWHSLCLFGQGVRQISWCVTGAIKVVALDMAHEQHNDSRPVLISLHLALCWGTSLDPLVKLCKDKC